MAWPPGVKSGTSTRLASAVSVKTDAESATDLAMLPAATPADGDE